TTLKKDRLTDSFRTAKIKIIPKKGDCTKIGNWRPISLLSCLYKVASRALNNRLKKVRDIIFSRAQKGFTNERHIQEVLINVIEGIAHCKKKQHCGLHS
ncbi:MAG: reverse transcriptase domain-containing protein, partial [bacterium]